MPDHASYKTTDRTPTHATIRVDVSPEEVRTVLDSVYAEYSQELRIPGFRKGKVPRNVLNTRFGEETFIDESQQRMRETHLPAALGELNLRPVSRPEIAEADAAIEGGLFSSCKAKTMPPPTKAKNRKRAATLFILSGGPVNICVNNRMIPLSTRPACTNARPGERLRWRNPSKTR